VTGTFGDSGAGLYLLEKGSKITHSYEKTLVDKHLCPSPRVDTAKRLSSTGSVTSMIDSSDGLSASLGFISAKSKAGMKIETERLPVSKELLELSFKDRKVSPLRLALSGGEDYELVFTAKPDGLDRVRKAAGDITCIGVVTGGKGVKYVSNGKAVKLGAQGYQAFIRNE
jgi:thiamine-monophosphate kinase